MANHYIDLAHSIRATANSQHALEIAGDDTIVVAQDGSIIAEGATAAGLRLTSAPAAVGAMTSINVFGSLRSALYFALDANAGSAAIHVGPAGTVTGGTAVRLNGTSVLTNEGSITATTGQGIICLAGSSSLTVFNTGRIQASYVYNQAIAATIGSDTIVNSGRIIGSIVLIGGNDAYYGQGGFVSGEILLGAGDDVAYGGSGPEVFNGELGNDTLDGGGGSDTLLLSWGPRIDSAVDLRVTTPQNTGQGLDLIVNIENVTGGTGKDTLVGNDVANVLIGEDNDDILVGNGGNDTFDGGFDNDVMNGGDGIDTVLFSYFDPAFDVAATVDLSIQAAQNTGYDNDTFISIENLIGAGGNDRFTGNAEANTFTGKAGNDTLDGAGGNDVLVQEAADGNDSLVGGAGTDTVVFAGTAGAAINLAVTTVQTTAYGADTLAGIENLTGGAGADAFTGDGLANVLIGHDGADLLRGMSGNDLLYGGTHADQLFGGTHTDQLFGEAGNDTLWGEAGADLLHGGADQDRLSGGSENDRLYGEAGNDLLYGDAGNDVLSGGTHNDRLYGGAGKDVLTGGSGRDIFVFNTALNRATNVDKITDFSVRDDTVWLDNRYMAKLGSGSEARPGRLNGKSLAFDSAKDADDYLIYVRKSGKLLYDVDGSGSRAAVTIAVLTKNLKLTASDFQII